MPLDDYKIVLHEIGILLKRKAIQPVYMACNKNENEIEQTGCSFPFFSVPAILLYTHIINLNVFVLIIKRRNDVISLD